MKYIHCKLCNYEDDIDYQHPLYDGKSNNFVLICEKCREKIFSDRERLSPEDHQKPLRYTTPAKKYAVCLGEYKKNDDMR